MKITRQQIPFLKSLIMFGVGLLVSALGSLSGIGVQVAAQPMVRFLLGLTPVRALGTSLAFGLVTAAAGMLGASLGGLQADLGVSLILGLSATLGALLVVRLAVDPKLTNIRRIAQTAAMLLGVYLISTAMRPSGIGGTDSAFFKSTAGFASLGVAAGLLSAVFHLASGVLLIGGLVLLSGMAAGQAIVVSLIVTSLASLIPSIAHAGRGGIDTGAGMAMIVGGVLGGLGGGLLLANLSYAGSAIPLIAFALTAMFLSAWTAWRTT
jgi:hypothetical protein